MPGTPSIDKGLIRTHELLEALRADVDKAYETLETDRQSQYLRRCVARAVSSYIEAMVECIKVELRSAVRLREFTGPLTDRESETLGPISFFSRRPSKFLALDQNIKRTFRLAAKIWGLKFRLATDGEDFRDFAASKAARDRLMHPKTYYDIEVTDGDMHCYTLSTVWLQHEFSRLVQARLEALETASAGTKSADA